MRKVEKGSGCMFVATYKIVFKDGTVEYVRGVETISTQLGCLTFTGCFDIHRYNFNEVQYFKIDSIYQKPEM